MDAEVRRRLEQKAREAESGAAEAGRLAGLLAGGSAEFAAGVAAGMLYNSFRYQTRRILGRDPTGAEFGEFLEFMRGRAPGSR